MMEKFMTLFGRKKVTPPTGPREPSDDPKLQPGHQAVLRHLIETEKTEPGARERLAGAIVFDLAYNLLKNERGVQIEIIIAVLASVAGQECIAPIVAAAPDNATMQELGLIVVKGHDGRIYFFGDPPNRLLVESPDSVISLAFGAAKALGAPVTMTMILEEMRKVASRVGGADFESLNLPKEHMVDRPTEWVRVFRAKLVEALDLYDVLPMRRATALGYALQKAIDAGKQCLDPLVAAQIALQCAARTSKIIVT
jgi:hypothetical protein